jgi:Tol biopolymer transport system component
VGDEELAALFLVSAQGGKARQLTGFAAPPAYVEHPTWSPDSRLIVFNLSPDGTMQAVRADGGGRHTIRPATEGFGGHKPWFSPDGSRILFMCENQGLLPEPPADYNEDICVMRADGSNIVNLTNTPSTFDNFPSWGPEARHDRKIDRRGD